MVAYVANQVVTGTLGSATTSSACLITRSRLDVSLYGTFVATVQLERTFDGPDAVNQGTANWIPCTFLGTLVTWTIPGTEVVDEPHSGVMYRWNCTSYTSGTISYRFDPS